jgi:hypothetical protein
LSILPVATASGSDEALQSFQVAQGIAKRQTKIGLIKIETASLLDKRVVVEIGVGGKDCAITERRPKIGCQGPTAETSDAITEPRAVAPDAIVYFGNRPNQ